MDFFRSREGEMKEEVISSGGPLDPLMLGRSSSPPATPGASSAGASSPSVPVNIGADWFSLGPASKAGSQSCVGSHLPKNSLSTNAGGSALGSSQPSCRPWERGDLLRRLATFNPSNWSGKPKVASSLACARRGWVNVDIDKIVCESCGARLSFVLLASWTPTEVDNASEAFAKQLDISHKRSCPWRGNICAESLVQFPPTPPSALIGGFKDRCDGLLQFVALPIIAASAISQIRITRSLQLDHLLSQSEFALAGESGFVSGLEFSRDNAFSIYSHAQKLISLCGWEPRWVLNAQDCEEHSAQSARDGCSFGPTKHGVSVSTRKDTGKKKITFPESRCDSRSPMLDCSLCGETVRIWDFLTVPRPPRFAPNNIDTPEVSKKMELTRGVSAASGISGWVAPEGPDEVKSISNIGVDLNLTMAGVLDSTNLNMGLGIGQFRDASMGRDLRIGQPSSSEVGDRAASFESRGPSRRKRNLEGGGSTVDRPQLQMQQADSVEGTVIDRDGDEVDDGSRDYSAGPSKRARGSSGAGPSNSFGFGMDIDVNRSDPYQQVNNYPTFGLSSARDSARASSVVAMDTVGRSGDSDSMESVENHPDDLNEVQKDADVSYSNQAQQSACFQPGAERVNGEELVVSSTNDGEEEILNADNTATATRDRISFGVSGGSVGMGASHEAEIHGIDLSLHRSDSVVGEVELIPEVVTENQGQTGESLPDPGVMGEFVPEDNMTSQSVGRDDSGSKIVGSTKADSVESGQKLTSQNRMVAPDNSAHPSHSCNAIVYSGYEASKEEVTQSRRADSTFLESDYVPENGIGPPNGESNYDEPTEFDPIKHHNRFCPWVNGNVAAAGNADVALCGWQLTLDALDAFRSLGEHAPRDTVPSESAASLCKDEHTNSNKKNVAHHSGNQSRGNKQ
ncbi:hypothetical protein ACHQM5_018032 [Ranunculus cassubicifolius]